MRVGMLSEMYPSLSYTDISRLLLQTAQAEAGLQELITMLDKQLHAGGKGEKAA